MKTTTLGWAGLLAALCCANAQATMYRCGNAFQDRPCETVTEQQRVKPGALRSTAGVVPIAPAARPLPEPPAAARPPLLTNTAAGPICANLVEQHQALDARLLSASRPHTADMLNRQKREVEKSLVEAGC